MLQRSFGQLWITLKEMRQYPVTLTTFRDVPWNRPWYQRMGYVVLAEDDLGPGLHARRRQEDADGLPAELRVCMRREVDRR